MPVATIEEMQAAVGGDPVASSWIAVDQARIDQFAEATGDHQFIHVDPDMAKQTPFGGTIAHGFLTLSLLSAMKAEVASVPSTLRMAINYGFDRVRFLAPVRSGKRVRGHFRAIAFTEKKPGQWQETSEVTIEIEGEDKPALTAEWITLYFVA